MEPIDDLSSTITATLHIFDQKYQTLFVKLNSAIEDQEGVYMNLVHTGSLEHTAQSFSLQPKIRVLQLVLLKLRGQIIIGKHSEPLSNLTLVLPDADATCRLLYDALEDLATHISQAHYQNEPKLFKALVYCQRTPSRETQTAKISEMLQKLEKEVSFIATIAALVESRKYRPLSLVMEMRLPALFSISTNTVDVDLDQPDAGEDDPMPLAPLNPQTMPQMAPQVPQAHFHTQSPHPPQTPPPQTPPPQTPPPQTPPPQTPPPQTPPPQTPPPQTPPPRSEDFQMDDINATPRAPPDMTPRAPQAPETNR
ncbi:hypothetical protein C8R41DRAFT_917279 [Lentinula lateritia]|uniref:Uncharacterized protein n=1 Tax=Lentinula lateritia TaxID=40482 RepID=A0ABQ8VSN5_9AGAR|nr:hypothetical protein C8R41DRAFT_917279 [Lentinula lateritia]